MASVRGFGPRLVSTDSKPYRSDRKLKTEVETLLSHTRAVASVLVQELPSRCSRHFVGSMRSRVVSCYNQLAIKRRGGFRREERSQDREHVRSKGKGNEYDRCCIFHVARSYQNPNALQEKFLRDRGN
jgi:hypothetical protein